MADLIPVDPNQLTLGEENMSRLQLSGGLNLTSGTLQLAYFTARRTEVCSQMRVLSASTAAATVTLVRFGVYTIDTSGGGTLTAAVASDTSVFASTFASYTRPFTSAFNKVAGQRYAYALLSVASTAGSTYGCSVFGGETSVSPRLTGAIVSQTDLPASFTAGQVTASSFYFYGAAVYT